MNMLSPAIQVGDMVNGGHLDPFAILACAMYLIHM